MVSSHPQRATGGKHPLRDIAPRTSLAVILLVVAVFILPIAVMGIPDGFDLMQHIRFAATYRDALLSGEIIPKWAGYDNFGFGSIGIRYYPPLAYIVLAATRIVSGSWYDSFWMTCFAWMLLGSIGIYVWVKDSGSNLAATFAAVAYVVIPYRSFQLYQAVLYSEFAASGILPFCFLFLSRMVVRQRWIDTILFCAAYSLMILTHIPSAIIATIAMTVYGLFILDRKRIGDLVIKCLAGACITIAATAFHLIKAIPELDWVKHNSPEFFANGSYDFKSYLFPIYLSAPPFRYLQKLLWHLDSTIFLTLLFLLIPLACVVFVRRSDRELTLLSRASLALFISGGFSIFMLSVASLFIWRSVMFLQKIQFPWRWLSIASLSGSILFGLALPFILFRKGRLRRLTAYPVMAFILVLFLFNISQDMIPSTPVSRADFQDKITNMYQEEACDCWWPIWAKREAFDTRRPDAGGRDASTFGSTEYTSQITVSAGRAGQLRIPRFYHPYWTAAVNGTPVQVNKDESGAIVIPIPSEPADVSLVFKEPAYVWPATILSFLTWGFILLFLSGYYLRRVSGHLALTHLH